VARAHIRAGAELAAASGEAGRAQAEAALAAAAVCARWLAHVLGAVVATPACKAQALSVLGAHPIARAALWAVGRLASLALPAGVALAAVVPAHAVARAAIWAMPLATGPGPPKLAPTLREDGGEDEGILGW
jgi:hypothetical protein